MTAIGLIFGALTADHYEDATAADPRIDALRAGMVVKEEPRYTREYLEADKRAIANAVQIFFRDGSATEKVEVEYPSVIAAAGRRAYRCSWTNSEPTLKPAFPVNASRPLKPCLGMRMN